jgi:L-threonylcarbamoyladenylate synthase
VETEVLNISADTPDPALIARAASVLQHGGLVAFPTETVYGLGASALDPKAVAKIFVAKGRPTNNPLIIHVARLDQVYALVDSFPAPALRLAERFWPGPLTLVLSKRAIVPDAVTAGGATVAVRVPAHPVAQALIEAAQIPVAAPSANRSSLLSPTRAEHVMRGLASRIDMLLDAGPTAGGLESTVLDVTKSPPRLLRPGPVTVAEMEAIVGPITRAATTAADGAAPMPSPGMLPRHYAPRAPLQVTQDDGRAVVEDWLKRGATVGWVTFAEPAQVPARVTLQVMSRDPAEYAAQFYAVLHALDAAGVGRIVVEMPPDTDAWLALRDRLRRASAPQ